MLYGQQNEFIDYFSNMGNIEDYLRFVKKEVINSTSSIFSLHDEFFNEDLHPEEMEFDIKFVGIGFNNLFLKNIMETC